VFATGSRARQADQHHAGRLSRALTALNEGRGDFLRGGHSLALFVNALHQDDQAVCRVEPDLADFTTRLAHSDQTVFQRVSGVRQPAFDGPPLDRQEPRGADSHIDNLAAPDHDAGSTGTADGWRTALALSSDGRGERQPDLSPVARGPVVSVPAITNSPTRCSSSALDSGRQPAGFPGFAELCAQYLAPVLDAIKFNYLPSA